MCGIVGYIGDKCVEKELVETLKNLEYRGYDSAGIAVQVNNEIVVTKASGKISNLEKIISQTDARTGIAHTRWATHGKPTEINAHPHVSENKEWAIVHNGIIENFKKLKLEAESKGIKFVSDTDTEVIPQLLALEDSQDYMLAFINACNKLQGSYALVGINQNVKDTLFLARKKSPLYVAVSNNEVIVASDPICFVNKCNEYYSLDEDEYCQVSANNIVFYNNKYNNIDKNTVCLSGIEENFGKQEYKHFMLKEINEIPNVLGRIVKTYRDNDVFSKINEDFMNRIQKIVIVGCGTAYHAGLMGVRYIEKLARCECYAYVASEFRYSNPIIDETTLCIFVSQSGETADTLAAHELAKSKGCYTIALTNVLYSSLAKSVDAIFPVCAGPEIAVASTKAYVAQVAIMYMFAKHLENLKFKHNVDYVKNISELANNLIMPDSYDIEILANELKTEEKAFFIGRDFDYINSEEASLKLKEITYINSSAYASGELKHGFLALIDDGTFLFVLATQKELLDKTLNGAHEAYARGAKIILATQLDIDTSKVDFVYKSFKLQSVEEELMPIVSIIIFQLLAYYTSMAKSLNPDQPRNLAKSVTVE